MSPTPLRSVVLCSVLYPPRQFGGAATYSDLFSRFAFDNDTVDVTVLTTWPWAGSPISRTPNGLVLRVLIAPTPRFRNKLFTRLVFLLNVLIGALAMVVLLLLKRPQVVHIVAKRTFIGTAVIARLFRRGVVVDVRDLGAAKLRLPRSLTIGCSLDIVSEINALNSEPTVHLPVPIFFAGEMIEEAVSFNTPTVVYVGEITARKGLLDLLDAWRIVVASRVNLELLLIGPGALGDVEIPDNVRVVGSLAHHEALRHIDGAELLVLPSHTEGVPRVALEAFHMNRKILLPAGILEFADLPREFIQRSKAPNLLAEQILGLVDSSSIPNYNLKSHAADRVFALMRKHYATYLNLKAHDPVG